MNMNTKVNGSWSDSKHWWMDLLKSAISFSVAGAVTLFVIDAVQLHRTDAKARADAFYQARLKALDDFRSTAIGYDMNARIAFSDLRQVTPSAKTPAMATFENESLVKWAMSLETIAYLFPSLEGKAKALSHLGAQRYRIYADERDTPSRNAQSSQTKFNDITDQIEKARSELVLQIHNSLFPSTRRE